MGDVYWGVHLPLAASAATLGIRKAIETGTYFGSGATHLAALFDEVLSVDASPASIEFCEAVLGPALPNVTFVHGDSGSTLDQLLADERGPVLFFLDAHWFPGADATLQSGPQCPLEAELDVISRHISVVRAGSVVLIDDADMLLRSLPAGFRDQDFPEISEVIRKLDGMGFEYVAVCDDVVVAGPGAMRDKVASYLDRRGAIGTPNSKRIVPS